MKIKVLTLFLLFLSHAFYGCSMFKMTHKGKTIVGNNEDWVSPNAEIWFEPKQQDKYGVAYVGFINRFPQGAMNEAGLVFDGFATPEISVPKQEGKIQKPVRDIVHYVMANFNTVHQVKDYLFTVDMSFLTSSVMMFVDKTGEYLLVEGGALVLGNQEYYIQSNFNPTKSTVDEDKKKLDYYMKGVSFLKARKPDGTPAFCSSVMDQMQVKDTQYTNIYDLNKGTIQLFLHHDFSQSVEINLEEELKKDTHSYMMADLFPATSEGVLFYKKYNNADNPAGYLQDIWAKGTAGKTKEEIENYKATSGLAWLSNYIGYEWMRDKKQIGAAIKIFTFATEMYPENANLFDSLGEAYWMAKDYKAAIMNYGKSLSLNPKNLDAIDMLMKIKQEQEKIESKKIN
ncbi:MULTISPECIES: hypothetical protein [Chryseobacterium]|uniref:hypothetical protein n=1 Tax=Chryseobacterium TaxID=59732 RepID=UPI0031CDD326